MRVERDAVLNVFGKWTKWTYRYDVGCQKVDIDDSVHSLHAPVSLVDKVR